jgi:mannose-6-phosphate isomerase-like protein (cupin superfamily)
MHEPRTDMTARGTRPNSLPILLSCALVLISACDQYRERGAKGVGLLPKPADAAQHLSGYEPKHPYSQLAQGLLARTAYQSPSGAQGVRIEVVDFLVGPQQRTASVPSPGALVLEIKSGDGILSVNDRTEKLSTGRTLSLQAGVTLTFENTGETPLAMQAHVLKND